jgi:hypothetical protein
MSMKNLFPDEEWQILKMSAIWVFHGIANADGIIDRNELNAMANVPIKALNFENELAREVLAFIDFEEEELINDYNAFSRIKFGLKEIDEILKGTVSHDIALGFKKTLLAVGLYIAKSSGDSENKMVSEMEEKAILKLTKFLNVSLIELMSEPTLEDILKRL